MPKHVAAVAVTITAVSPTAAGGLVVFEAGAARPVPQNVRFGVGRSSAATAIVRVSSVGKVTVFNTAHSGSTQVTIDVSGYYVAGRPSAETPGALHTLTPRHALGVRTIGAHRTLTANLGGRDGVPASSVGAVAVLITASGATKSGGLIAYQAGGRRPHAVATTFTKRFDSTGFALVPTDGDGRISLYNTSKAKVRVAVDVAGYTVGGIVTTAGTTQVGSATRIVDGARLHANHAKTVTVTGRGGVPDGHITAVLLNLQASSPLTGSLVAWRADAARPGTTNLRLNPAETTAGLALVRTSPAGKIKIRNGSQGTVALSVDVVGYVAAKNAPPVAAPQPSDSHYVRTVINGGASDAQNMYQLGCTDAMDGSTPGTARVRRADDQSAAGRRPPGRAAHHHRHPADLPAIETALIGDSELNGYLTGFNHCASGLHATIALGTNNDGVFTGDERLPGDHARHRLGAASSPPCGRPRRPA